MLQKTIAAVQMDVTFGDVDANLQRVLGKIEGLANQKIDVAVFPECVLTGYCFESRDEAMPFARTLEDPLWQRVVDACAAASLHAVVGHLELHGDRLFNAQALVGPTGILGSYRKIHLPGLGVDRFVDPGDRPFAVQDAGGTRIGMAICYDSSFPETSRVLGLQKADVVALSTNWPDAARRTAEVVPSARSMENHLYFVAANPNRNRAWIYILRNEFDYGARRRRAGQRE